MREGGREGEGGSEGGREGIVCKKVVCCIYDVELAHRWSS